ISCSTDEHANAKLKACDSGAYINDVIALDDDDHRSSNSNFNQFSSSCKQLINHISPPKTETLTKNQSSH
ncbi:hypothetical protein PGT21_005525, partial [Puccinia graminis f. sp. tritici]